MDLITFKNELQKVNMILFFLHRVRSVCLCLYIKQHITISKDISQIVCIGKCVCVCACAHACMGMYIHIYREAQRYNLIDTNWIGYFPRGTSPEAISIPPPLLQIRSYSLATIIGLVISTWTKSIHQVSYFSIFQARTSEETFDFWSKTYENVNSNLLFLLFTFLFRTFVLGIPSGILFS